MRRVAVAHVIALPRLQAELRPVFETNIQRSAETQNYVPFGAPVISGISSGMFHHANANVSEVLRAPCGDSTVSSMFGGRHLRPVGNGHGRSRHLHADSIVM